MAIATRFDEEIKQDLIDQLYWDDTVDVSDVTVEVSGGEVVLAGTVPDYAAYRAAEENAWMLPGVRYVRNDLIVKFPGGGAVPSDAHIKSNIENMLLWQPNSDGADIQVHVERNWVTLAGTVDAYWKKVRAEEAALSLGGVAGVTNSLNVLPAEAFEDLAIAEDIRAASERNAHIPGDLIDVEVEDGKVKLTGSVPSLPAFRAVQTIAERTRGVRIILNRLVIG
ncbi:MAG: BON domain-containing protein [Phycisphaerae bacterium]|nr:BON domain-containing protein [Phycisphaerae bacterium]